MEFPSSRILFNGGSRAHNDRQSCLALHSKCQSIPSSVHQCTTDLTHELKNLGQILQRSSLERCLDQATSKEIHSLLAVLAVADVAALDFDHLDHCREDGSLEERIGRHTDGDDCTARTGVLHSLLEGFLRDGEQNHRVGAQGIRGRSLDVGDEILGLGEVDVGLVAC